MERCITITPSIRLSECGDPDDDRILECAVAAKADYLVTGNIKHFPRQHAGVKILTARQLLDLLG